MQMQASNFNGDKYRFGFNGKEKDKETYGEGNEYDYGFRIYNPRIGKFLSVDPLTIKYPMLTPFQFASNTPIQAIDLDGLEAFYVHGTWSEPKTFSHLSITTIDHITGNTQGAEFKWSGYNTDRARKKAARDLANHIMKNRDPNQPLTLVGHSHGGNVAIMAANILKKRGVKVDNIITINTPVREYQLDAGAAGKHVNIYQLNDPFQGSGGNAVNIPDGAINIPTSPPSFLPTYNGTVKGTGELGNAGRTFNDAINICVPFDIKNVHNTHNTSGEWGADLDNAINPPPPTQPGPFLLPDIPSAVSDKTRKVDNR